MKRIIGAMLILLVLTLNVKGQDYSRYTGCAEQDSLALVAFYNATGGANWISNQNGFSISSLTDNALSYHTTEYPNSGMGKWLQGPVKDWFGVLLEKQPIGVNGDSIFRVVHLIPTISRRSAGDNNMIGYIPREVGLLTAMKWFKVNGNKGLTKTELPEELWHPSLEVLDLEAVYLQGQMSSNMRKCTKMRTINFRYNLFDSVPVFDYLSKDFILNTFTSNGGETFFFYQNCLPYSNIEASIKYFLTFSNAKQVKYEAREQHDMGREREVIVTPGQKVVLSTNVGGENGTYTWYKKGFNTYLTGSTYTINSAAVKDTGAYKVLVVNEFVRLGDYNSDYKSVYSSPIYVRFAPAAPFVQSIISNYAGTELEVTFTKPMAVPTQAQASEFIVNCNGQVISVSKVKRSGRFNERLILQLASPIGNGNAVTLSYNAGTIVCTNNGSLGTFTGKMVQNLARISLNVVSAITRDDGSGLFLTFDQFIDPSTLQASEFTVKSGSDQKPSVVFLKTGTIDAGISKTIELVLPNALKSTDSITISYAMGSLSALYGSLCEPFELNNVQNNVLAARTPVLIQVEDGTKEFQSIVVEGTMKNLPFLLYDNGTNGDLVANDHIWCKSLDLSDGQYSWEVFSRTVTLKYDTVRTVNENGSITLTITPTNLNKDVLVSAGFNLQVNVSGALVSGSTFFGYKNKKLTFMLDMSTYAANNQSSTIAPHLMGLKNDWSEGLEMKPAVTNPGKWTVSVDLYSIGDVVSFNFRNGYDWENSSPVSRTHVVVSNDTIYSTYGLFTNVRLLSKDNKTLVILPNPVAEQLQMTCPDGFEPALISILDVCGKELLSTSVKGTTMNVSNLVKGLYLVRVKSSDGNFLQSKFVKK